MNRYRLLRAGVEVREGIQRFNGNKELYEEFLNQFPDDPHFPELCHAIRKGAAKEAFEAGHALKGVAGNLSLNDLYRALIPLVEALRVQNLADSENLLATVEEQYQRVLSALKGSPASDE